MDNLSARNLYPALSSPSVNDNLNVDPAEIAVMTPTDPNSYPTKQKSSLAIWAGVIIVICIIFHIGRKKG